ncbi:hypothetical protein [Butyrivibrio sp. YAB3001]|uniref:hypothetical protein n=1 Tax=Butyrivibrio sp. YAB3001 TaxID=1520812 RepID=UPI0008F629EC|nr:hypothetical protein [Butyrivibrio sp. YAB3001]SFC23205.1 hypothetical protein SAMN02910398_01820 [Butyrivibrio sp. YAB3001]
MKKLIKMYGYNLAIIILIILFYLPSFQFTGIQDGDEFPSIAAPLRLAGVDWSGILSKNGIWHGYGHIFMLFPFFYLCKDWASIYIIIKSWGLFIWVFMALAIHYLCKKFLNCTECQSFVIAIICVLGVLKPDYGFGLSALTEEFIGFALVIISLLHEQNNKSPKWYLAFGSGFLMTYLFTIHSRAAIIVVSYIFVFSFFYIMNKDSIKISIILLFVVGLISGYLVYKGADSFYVRYVLSTNESVGSLDNNATSMVSRSLSSALMTSWNKNQITDLLKLIFSLTESANIISFGYLFVCITSIILYTINKYKMCKMLDGVSFIGIWGIISFTLMNLSIALKNYMKAENEPRMYLYIRYAIPFCILIILSGTIIIIREIEKFQNAYLLAGVVSVISYKMFMVLIVPKLNSKALMAMASIFKMFFCQENESPTMYFNKLLFYEIIICFVIIFRCIKHKEKLVISIYLAVSLFFWISSFDYKGKREDSIIASADASTEVLNWAEKENINIYVTTKQSNAPGYIRSLQTYNVRTKLNYLNEDEISELTDGILLSDLSKINTNVNLYSIQIDDNEYAYSKDLSLLQLIPIKEH